VTVVFHFPLPCITLCPVAAYHVVEVYPCVCSSDAGTSPLPTHTPHSQSAGCPNGSHFPQCNDRPAHPPLRFSFTPSKRSFDQQTHYLRNFLLLFTFAQRFCPIRFLNGRGDLRQQPEAEPNRCYGSQRNLPSYVSCCFAPSHGSVVP
jgi:hypothetical protein